MHPFASSSALVQTPPTAAATGPQSSHNTAAPSPGHVRALYVVTGPADPGLLPRVIETVAKLGHVPSRVHASRESGDGSELTIDLRLASVPARTAEQVEFALRAIIGLRQVFAVIEPLN